MKLRNSPKIELNVLNIRTAPVGSQMPQIMPKAMAIKILGNSPNRFMFFLLILCFCLQIYLKSPFQNVHYVGNAVFLHKNYR